MKSPILPCVRLLPLLLLVGCGRPAIVPVQGKVTYHGHGLRNGLVVFTPDTTREQRGPLAVGRIREDGSFVLYTGDAPGAYPGQYRVTVCSLATGTPGETWGRFEFPKSAIPDKYRDPDLSRLACDVKPNNPNSFNVDLTDQ